MLKLPSALNKMAAESLDLHTVTHKFQTGIVPKPHWMMTAEPPDAMLKSQIFKVIEKGDTTVKKESFMTPMQVCHEVEFNAKVCDNDQRICDLEKDKECLSS